MAFNFPIAIILSIVGLTLGNADTMDLHAVASIERQTQTMVWKSQSTCGPIDYKLGIYKKWDLQDSSRPLSVGKCSGACKREGFSKCKSFIYYYRLKNCMLLNYEVDHSKFKTHVSAACGYWVGDTASPTKSPVLPPTKAPSVTKPECKAVIELKFANKPDDVGVFGQHNDYLVVTKRSKNKDFDYPSCCYNELTQWWGCEHDGGDAVFENFEDQYYDYIESEKVVISNVRGGQFVLESKHYFNDFEANYYGKGYKDHTVPAKMTVKVNGVVIKRLAHGKNVGRDTHIYTDDDASPQINPEYKGYVKAKLRCDRNCDCHVNVFKNETMPSKKGPCDKFILPA